MAWPNPFRRKDENTRSRWGYTFQLTDDHLSPEQSYPLKYSYDTLGEECLNRLNEIASPERNEKVKEGDGPEMAAKTNSRTGRRDLYVLLRDHWKEDGKLRELWEQVNTVPEWVDWEQVCYLMLRDIEPLANRVDGLDIEGSVWSSPQSHLSIGQFLVMFIICIPFFRFS
jgi:hypothetical protein